MQVCSLLARIHQVSPHLLQSSPVKYVTSSKFTKQVHVLPTVQKHSQLTDHVAFLVALQQHGRLPRGRPRPSSCYAEAYCSKLPLGESTGRKVCKTWTAVCKRSKRLREARWAACDLDEDRWNCAVYEEPKDGLSRR